MEWNDEIANKILYEVLVESKTEIPEGMKDFVFERFMDDNNPSIVLNEYIGKLEGYVDGLRRLYYRNASNRNGAVEESLEIMSEIERETTLAREKMKISPPEDVNEDDARIEGMVPAQDVSVQIGDERIKLKNSQMKPIQKDGVKGILLKASPDDARKIKNAHVKPLFLIDSFVFVLNSDSGDLFNLRQMNNQHNALDLFLALNNPSRYDSALKRLERI